jgi:hypothetical protein
MGLLAISIGFNARAIFQETESEEGDPSTVPTTAAGTQSPTEPIARVNTLTHQQTG